MRHTIFVQSNRTATVSQPTHKIDGIEAGRGIAAMLVIFYHVSLHINDAYGTPYLRAVFQFGHAGVDFFFTISGFIILYVHYNDIGCPDSLRRYVRRRFTRLMPTYWVALAISAAMTAAGHHPLPPLKDLFWSVTLLPSNHDLIVGVAWTLRLELLFYISFCVLILNRNAGFILFTSWFCLVSYSVISGARLDVIPGQFTSGYNLEFFFGMLVACIAKRRRLNYGGSILLLGLVLFALAGILEDFNIINGYHHTARIIYGIPSAIILMGIVVTSERGSVKLPRHLQILGSASYSLYLFQFIFIGIVWQIIVHVGIMQDVPPLIQFCVLVLSALVGGIATSRMVEQPLIRRVRTWLGPSGGQISQSI
jgi:exopolysaccharide production protein ExoZ